MNAVLSLEQGSPEWHEHRKQYRNASETPAVLGVSPWVTPFMLWEIKTGRRVQEINWAMQRGIELEPQAREAYEVMTGHVMQPRVMVDGLYSASLDGINLAGNLILEVKCPVNGMESETWKAAVAGEVPTHYYWQIQQQLMVSNATMCHFYVYDGESGLLVNVLPNRNDMERLRAAWDRFQAYLDTDTPPPLTELDTVIREDADWQICAENYIGWKGTAEEAAIKADEAKSKLISLAQHNQQRGCGVSVCKYWKGEKQEVRVTVLKQEIQPC